MLRFTPKQVAELGAIIDRYTHLFVGVHIGHDFLTPDVIQQLAQYGIELPNSSAPNYLEAAFRFGLLSVAIGNSNAKVYKYSQLKKYLASGQFMPLTRQERDALDFVRRRAYTDITGLGKRILNDLTGDTLVNDGTQAENYRDVIRTSTEHAVKNRLSTQQLASILGHKTGDWARDFHRIADYLMHEAFDNARALSYLRIYGPQAEVFKDVYAGACPTCQRLYLTGAIGSEPRTFKVAELLANGTNVGRKAKDVLPVIGPTHPYCFTENVPIHTSKGWKKIKDVKVGDLVLTHARRFRKVTDLIRHSEKRTDFEGLFSLKFSVPRENGSDVVFNISNVTGTHPFMTNKGWRKLSEIEQGSDLYLLHEPCANKDCNTLVPVFKNSSKFCCKTCSASHNSIEQWSSNDMREKMSTAITAGNHKRYSNSTLDQRRNDTSKARKAVEGKGGNYDWLHTPEIRSKIASSNGKRCTFIERKLQYFLTELGVEFIVGHTVMRKEQRANGQSKVYYPDIYIPKLNLVLEADGEFWHNESEEQRLKRDNDIKELIGADVFHFKGDDIRYKGDKVFEEIKRLVNNHSGKYCFKKIVLLKKRELISVSNEEVKLYNFSVEEDESYIANGILVHNCRCTVNVRPAGSEWNVITKTFELTRYTDDKASDRIKNRRSRVKVTIT
jgi:very-short-patch-repair endonuclease